MNVQPQPILGELDHNTLAAFYQELRDVVSENPSASMKGREFLISSPGGDVGVMLSLFDHIRLNGGITIGSGLLQSAAAVLLQAGKVRRMMRNSLLLFHEPKAVSAPGMNEPKIPDQEWTLHTHLVGLIADRTGMNEIEAYDLFDGKFINPERALNLNLIDEIVELPVIPVYREGQANG